VFLPNGYRVNENALDVVFISEDAGPGI